MDICAIEKSRVEVQREIDNNRDAEEKNKCGQYATPNKFAYDIVQCVINIRDQIVDKGNKITFLEPALGTGSFYSALLQSTEKEPIERSLGIEIDKEIFDCAKNIWKDYNIEIINSDFTLYKPSDKELFNLVITNPPYVRHHHLTTDQKAFLQQSVKNELGLHISGYAGLYCYFLLSTHKWLQKNALCSWLIPSEFMDVNYGKVIRDYLTRFVTIKRIHKYDTSYSHFSDAIVSSSVVIYINELPKDDDEIQFSYGGTINEPNRITVKTVKELKSINKWGPLFSETETKSIIKKQTLADFFDIKRGIATGNNEFFVLTEKQIIDFDYPLECFRPILPPPRRLNQEVINKDDNGLPVLDERLFVIDTELTEDELKERYSNFWEYLNSGKVKGITDGYLVKSRKIWYSQEKRDPVPFLCTYMGRGKNGSNPFKFIWNKSLAIASNSYILLYPKGKLVQLLNSDSKLYLKVLNALNSIETNNFYSEGREYGGGLKKIEPKELAKVQANNIMMDIPELK